jgi:hypothetical protein
MASVRLGSVAVVQDETPRFERPSRKADGTTVPNGDAATSAIARTPPSSSRKRGHDKVQLESPSDTEEDLGSPLKRRSRGAKVDSAPEKSSSNGVGQFDREHQDVLLLHGAKQRYAHTPKQSIPRPKNDREMLVQVKVIGLNPIDWKAP